MVQIKNSPHNDPNYDVYFESFAFPLSDFQKHAIQAIVDGNHVLVTAHTGSGKTLPAEFAIGHFTSAAPTEQRRRRVIYTAPIKALSNQKFYEFTRKFPSVSFGIITGDIKCNPDADVLIMTTEILLNSLSSVRGASSSGTAAAAASFQIDINTELAAVIFDEVHYINDADRGKTWEQTILMLPAHVQMIMLSATIDAPEKFAEWVENRYPACEKAVVLSSTHERVVPLTHYTFLTTTEGFFKTTCKGNRALEQEMRAATNKFAVLQDSRGQFREDTYIALKRARGHLDGGGGGGSGVKRVPRSHVLNQLARKLCEQDMMPAIAFVFSRKMVEQYAEEITVNLFQAPAEEFDPRGRSGTAAPSAHDEMSLYDDSKIPYIVARECEQILRAKLPNYREYMQLPEYVRLVALLEKGIAIHHAGMLPVLREIVEFMISKKYVKLLFATESFAIGLDCPIKTAIFTSLSKYDGSGGGVPRYVFPHEYSQMAGRAGRRGRDTVGHVIHCNNMFDLPTVTEYKHILCGRAQSLVSKFHIHYSLLLKLLLSSAAVADIQKEANAKEAETVIEFVKKSMLSREIQTEIEADTRRHDEMRAKLREKENSLRLHKTPASSCARYIEIETAIPRAVNKKRRELERELAGLKDEFKTIAADAAYMRDVHAFADEVKDLGEYVEYMKNDFFASKIGFIMEVLEKHGLVASVASSPTAMVALTPLGEIAAKIGEIHPVIFADFMVKYEWCAAFTTHEIAAIFSCLCDVAIPVEKRRTVPDCENLSAPVCAAARTLESMYMDFADMETSARVNTGIVYEGVVAFDLMPLVLIWARDCETEEECKRHIQGPVAAAGISVGDFTKALLKISNMAREVAALCEETQVDFAAKLARMDEAILKYVVTLQSLYL